MYPLHQQLSTFSIAHIEVRICHLCTSLYTEKFKGSYSIYGNGSGCVCQEHADRFLIYYLLAPLANMQKGRLSYDHKASIPLLFFLIQNLFEISYIQYCS